MTVLATSPSVEQPVATRARPASRTGCSPRWRACRWWCATAAAASTRTAFARAMASLVRRADRVVIFRDTLLRDFGVDPARLRGEVRDTLRHEIAHHLGWDEGGVPALGFQTRMGSRGPHVCHIAGNPERLCGRLRAVRRRARSPSRSAVAEGAPAAALRVAGVAPAGRTDRHPRPAAVASALVRRSRRVRSALLARACSRPPANANASAVGAATAHARRTSKLSPRGRSYPVQRGMRRAQCARLPCSTKQQDRCVAGGSSMVLSATLAAKPPRNRVTLRMPVLLVGATLGR